MASKEFMKLSVLICHLPQRNNFLKRLHDILYPQIIPGIECLLDDDIYEPIGTKRNRLLQRAKGDYCCFIDDDDFVSDDYISLLFEGISKNVDCCSLKGLYTEDGKNPKAFIHSIQYHHYFELEGIYYRPPNHLNCIKTSIAKRFKFPQKNWGEDTNWAMDICRSKVLKSEHTIDQTIYFYEHRSTK